MRQSQLFTDVLRAAPKDAESANAKLLERGGFVYKNSAGVYSYLPLGWRVIQNIARIVREEMDAIGGQEMLMPALVEKKYLEPTKRWDINIGFKVGRLRMSDQNFTLGWTHEEVLTAIAAHYIHSYKDLPFAAYQIQTKFRNEARAKSGILRGREFLMKDLYSFHATQEDFEAYYVQVKGAYEKVFARCGLTALYTIAGGGAFTGSTTHEFQVVSDIGEDTIFVCSACGYAENAEVASLKKGVVCPTCGGTTEEKKSIEVGNIFPLGTKYADALNLAFLDKDGVKKSVIMGSYGIGISRVMGTIAEMHHDDQGLAWPRSVAPFQVHLLELTRPTSSMTAVGTSRGATIYKNLQDRGVAVLYDDRDASPGDKFAAADAIGIPYRAVVSEKTGEYIELKERTKKETRLVSAEELIHMLAQ